MTISNSPLQIDSKDSSPEKDFSIHTMQDDLANFHPNNSTIKENFSAPKTDFTNEKLAPFATTQKEDLVSKPESEIKINSTSNKLPESSPVLTEIPAAQNNYVTPKSAPNLKIIFSIIIILVFSIIGVGVYYFWATKTSTQKPVITNQSEIPIETENKPIETPPVTIETPIEKYSQTKPNYLTVDINNLAGNEIKELILKTTSEINSLNIQGPIEFIIVDNNNNPISFPIFAIATNLKLSQNILSNLDGTFSLFVYNDTVTTNTHLAFAATIINKETATREALNQEKSFPSDLNFMFLDIDPAIKSGQFKDGSYNNIKTRYFNLSSDGKLSIDYTIDKNQFILGTSQNTLRTVLDKLSTTKTTETIPVGAAGDTLTTQTSSSASN